VNLSSAKGKFHRAGARKPVLVFSMILSIPFSPISTILNVFHLCEREKEHLKAHHKKCQTKPPTKNLVNANTNHVGQGFSNHYKG